MSITCRRSTSSWSGRPGRPRATCRGPSRCRWRPGRRTRRRGARGETSSFKSFPYRRMFRQILIANWRTHPFIQDFVNVALVHESDGWPNRPVFVKRCARNFRCNQRRAGAGPVSCDAMRSGETENLGWSRPRPCQMIAVSLIWFRSMFLNEHSLQW